MIIMKASQREETSSLSATVHKILNIECEFNVTKERERKKIISWHISNRIELLVFVEAKENIIMSPVVSMSCAQRLRSVGGDYIWCSNIGWRE